MPNLSRLKSIRRYCCLWPPPRCREVTWPWLLRPPDSLRGSSRLFSGVARVISSNPDTDLNRVAAVMGRNCRMLISALEHGDGIAVLQCDNGLLPARGGAAGLAPHHRVAAHLHGPHAGDRDAKELLQRVPDLELVGQWMDLEGVFLPGLIRDGAFFGHHRTHDNIMQGRHYLSPF